MQAYGMNQRGHILIFILIGFVILALLPVIITILSPEARIVMQLIMIFVIYTTIRGYLGPGYLSIIISAVLIYFMVFKWFEVFLSLYILQLLLGLGFLSTVIWGIGTTMRR